MSSSVDGATDRNQLRATQSELETHCREIANHLETITKSDKRDDDGNRITLAILKDEDGKRMSRMCAAAKYYPCRVAKGESKCLHVQFLAAGAETQCYEELREVETALRKMGCLMGMPKGVIRIHPHTAVTPDNFSGCFNEGCDGGRAHIVSYCGHAVTEGPNIGCLVLDKGIECSSGETNVADVFSSVAPLGVKSRLHGLVLNACETDLLYNDLVSPPGFVISTNEDVRTGAGVAFARHFYEEIAKNNNLLDCYYQAVVHVSKDTKDAGIHELHINESKLASIVDEIGSTMLQFPRPQEMRQRQHVQQHFPSEV
jgi:hypothetical protein